MHVHEHDVDIRTQWTTLLQQADVILRVPVMAIISLQIYVVFCGRHFGYSVHRIHRIRIVNAADNDGVSSTSRFSTYPTAHTLQRINWRYSIFPVIHARPNIRSSNIAHLSSKQLPLVHNSIPKYKLRD